MQEHGEADEARIAALFREAASGAPPPGFDATQVVATSRRITRRRRSAVAGPRWRCWRWSAWGPRPGGASAGPMRR